MGTLRVYSMLTDTSLPIRRCRRNSLASGAQGSGARSRVAPRGALIEDRFTRRSVPAAASLTTRQSPEATSATVPVKVSESFAELEAGGT